MRARPVVLNDNRSLFLHPPESPLPVKDLVTLSGHSPSSRGSRRVGVAHCLQWDPLIQQKSPASKSDCIIDHRDPIIIAQIMTDQNFQRQGSDIYTSVTIPFTEAILGTKVNIKTLSKTVSLSVPAGTQPGTILRLNGQGLAVNGTSGDLFVEIKVSLPKTLTDEQRKMIEEWGK